ISAGSFKAVYRGLLKVLIEGDGARRVPVAVLKIRSTGNGEELQGLHRVGRHPRLVKVMGLCEGPGFMLLPMELAERGSLKDALGRLEGQVSLQHKLVMMQQIAQGMGHLAENGIVHRKLGAHNVLLFGFDPNDVR
ncbi:hypothetical protein GUITHDRAFT_57062, partial [Guillardia theta CCMP2712]